MGLFVCLFVVVATGGHINQAVMTMAFTALLRLPFALIFSTLTTPSIHSLGKVTCVYLFPFLPIFHNHSFFYYLNLFFFSLTRTVGILVCTHSLMPLHSADASARLTSHISVESCACCELSQGTQIPISYTQCGMLSIIIMMCFHCSIYLFKCFCVFNRYLNRL